MPTASLGGIAPGLYDPGLIVSDGQRWAAWRYGEHKARVFDASSRTVFDVTLPEDCDGPNSGLTAAGGGQLVLWCQDVVGPPHSLLLDLSTKAFTAIPGAPRCEDASYSAIGKRWALVVCSGSHQPAPYYVNWRTGETGAPNPGRRSAVSLDTASLSRPLCAPVRRQRTSKETGLADPIPLGGWVVTGGPNYGTEHGLPFQRCGTKKLRFLRCGAICRAGVGDGWLLLQQATGRLTVVVRAVRIGKQGPGKPIAFMPDLPGPRQYPAIVGTYVLANINGVVTAWHLPGSRPLPSVP